MLISKRLRSDGELDDASQPEIPEIPGLPQGPATLWQFGYYWWMTIPLCGKGCGLFWKDTQAGK